jgi:hypothetical protein
MVPRPQFFFLGTTRNFTATNQRNLGHEYDEFTVRVNIQCFVCRENSLQIYGLSSKSENIAIQNIKITFSLPATAKKQRNVCN